MRLESIVDHLSHMISPVAQKLRLRCEQLLRVNFGGLPDMVLSLIEELSPMVCDRPEIEKERQSFLNVAMAINREIGKAQFSQEKAEMSHREMAPEPEDSADYFVCRICEERIQVENIDEHTRLCYNAYANASLVKSINEQLECCRREITTAYLQGPWPGEEKCACSTVLPFLHISTMIDKVIKADVEECDKTEDIEWFASTLSRFYAGKSQVQQVLTLMKQKLRASKAWRCMQISGYVAKPQQHSLSIGSFDFVKLVSKGAYARVFLARKCTTGDLFAIKAIPKYSLNEKNHARRLLNEKDILKQFNMRFNCPYIVDFYYSFVGDRNLYIVMEYLPGGDLFSLLHNVGALDEDTAKIYTFQIVQALKCLRELRIIHRDLKPDNIMIAKNGTLKLTDFGLSYMGMVSRQRDPSLVQSHSYVGTPDYIAPEIILNKGHSFPVDLWSLGIIIYEFLVGEPPFHGPSEQATHRNILSGRLERREEISDTAWDLITRLLVRTPEERIGASNICDLLAHPWFEGINPESVAPPFRPELESETSTEYFATRYTFGDEENDILTDIREAAGGKSDSDQAEFPFESVSVNKLAAANLRAAKKMKKRARRTSSYLPSGTRMTATSDASDSRLVEMVRYGSGSTPSQVTKIPALL